MRRILFVDHAKTILGGAEINLVEFLRPGLAMPWEVSCACASGSPLHQRLESQNVMCLPYGFSEAANRWRAVGRRMSPRAIMRGRAVMREARRAFARVLDRVRPDFVITCTNKDHLAVTNACRLRRIPVIWWFNDILSSEFFPWLVRWIFLHHARRGPSRIVTVSEYARRRLLDHGLSAELVTTVHNGIPMDRYRNKAPGEFRRRFALPRDEPVVGMVGRYTPWKGQDFFLQIVREWTKRHPQGHFVLIGHAFNEDHEYENRLREFVAANQLNGRVQFIPFQEDITEALGDLDVLIHASLKPEPFGRVLIEAMAMGVAVIGAHDGAVPEIITPPENGFLAPPGNLEKYLGCLQEILESEHVVSRLRRTGPETVRSRFTVDRVRDRFRQIIDQLD